MVKVGNVGDNGNPYTYAIVLFKDEDGEKIRDIDKTEIVELERKLSEITDEDKAKEEEKEKDRSMSKERKLRKVTKETSSGAPGLSAA